MPTSTQSESPVVVDPSPGSASIPYIWMLCGSFSFAMMSTLAHALHSYCTWQVTALIRAFLTLVFAAILAWFEGAPLVFWRPASLWMRSIAGSISLVCTFFAITRLPVSDVLTVTNMFPVWVALLSWPILKERPSARVWVAVVSGIAGIYLIQQPHLADGNFASLIALLSSVASAIAMLGLHRLNDIDARAIVVHFSGVASLFCLATLVLFEPDKIAAHDLSGRPLFMLLGVGLTATVGQIFLTKAFVAGIPSKVSVVGLTQIVFAMAFDVLLFDRSFNAASLLGIFLVFAPTGWLLAFEKY